MTASDADDAADKDSWASWFKRFLEYPPNKSGVRQVPAQYVTSDGYRLGVWQQNQRQARKKGALGQVRPLHASTPSMRRHPTPSPSPPPNRRC